MTDSKETKQELVASPKRPLRDVVAAAEKDASFNKHDLASKTGITGRLCVRHLVPFRFTDKVSVNIDGLLCGNTLSLGVTLINISAPENNSELFFRINLPAELKAAASTDVIYMCICPDEGAPWVGIGENDHIGNPVGFFLDPINMLSDKGSGRTFCRSVIILPLE